MHCVVICFVCFVFFFKQKTAYEMRISDWSSDVCSSDLLFAGVLKNDIANAIDVLRSDGKPAVVSLSDWLSDGKSFDSIAAQVSGVSQAAAVSPAAALSVNSDETAVRVPSYSAVPLMDVVESGIDSANRLALLRQDMATFSAAADFGAMEWKATFPERSLVFM